MTATAWAAVAALGSFAAALVTLAVAIINHRLTGARPTIRLEYVAIDPFTVSRLRVGASLPKGIPWPEAGLECIAVRIENRGRVALTVQTPRFEMLPSWRNWRRWRPRFAYTTTTTPYPVEGAVIKPRVRIKPYDVAEYVLEIAPLFVERSFGRPRHLREWKYVRVRVPVAGQRDKIARRAKFVANPTMPQRSGMPVTLDQILARTLLRDALMRQASDSDSPGPRSTSEVNLALMRLRREVRAADGRLSPQAIERGLDFTYEGERSSMAFTLETLLDEHGFLAADETEEGTEA